MVQYYTRPSVQMVFLIFFFLSINHKLSAQGNTCATATNITAANILNGSTCNVSATPKTELWWKLQFAGQSYNGPMRVQFSNKNAVNIQVEVYRANCGALSSNLINRADDFSAKGTEALTFSVNNANDYLVRVSVVGGSGPNIEGDLCVYANGSNNDLARNALPITVGTCDFDFEVSSFNLNNEAPILPVYTTSPAVTNDAWLVFDPDEGGFSTNDIIGFSYTNDSKNMAIFIYYSPKGDGSDLVIVDYDQVTAGVQEAVVNEKNVASPPDGETEVIQFAINNQLDVPGSIDDKYFIRVANLEGGVMTGKGCLYQVYGRNSCSDATIKTLPVNACDIPVSILSANTLVGTTSTKCAGTTPTKDIFFKYTTSSSASTLNVTFTAPTVNHQLMIYKQCSDIAVPNKDEECDQDINGTSVNISVSGSTEYIIRIASGQTLQGKLCVFEGENVLSDACTNGSTLTVVQEPNGCTYKRAVLLPNFNSSNFIKNCIDNPNPVFAANNLAATGQDGWVKLVINPATYGKEVTVVYDNNNGSATIAPDVELQLFSTAAGCPPNSSPPAVSPTPIACVNNVSGEGIESFTFTPSSGNEYFVRVSNMEKNEFTPNDKPTIIGKICAFEKTLAAGDICTNAIGVTVGDCVLDLTWQPGEFFNNPAFTAGGSQNPCTPAAPAGNEDIWISFTATSTKTTIEFQEASLPSKAVNIEIYRGSCGSLNKVTISGNSYCQSVAAPFAELNLVTIPSSTYFVRIISLDGNPIKGKLCLYETIAQDVCDNQTLVTKYVGSCNMRFSIPDDFNNNGSDANMTPGRAGTDPDEYTPCSGITGADRDAYMRFVGNGKFVTIQYESLDSAPVTPTNNDNEADDPILVVYTKVLGLGPVNCGIGINGAGNLGNEFSCSDKVASPGKQTESVTFQTVAGQIYVVRILDKNPGKMRGTLCITEGGLDHNECNTSLDINHINKQGIVEGVGECNRQMSIIANGGDEAFSMSGPSYISDNSAVPAISANQATALATSGLPIGSDIIGFTTSSFMKFTVTSGPKNISIAYYKFIGTATIEVFNSGGGSIGTVSGSDRVTLDLSSLANGDYVVTVNGSTGGDRRLTVYQKELGPPADAWAVFTTKPGNLGYPPGTNISVQYDNDNGNFVVPAQDVQLEVYSGTCGNTMTAVTPVSPSTDYRSDVVEEGIEQVTFEANLVDPGNLSNPTNQETFRVRVIQKHTAGGSTYGTLCTFYGETIAGGPECYKAGQYTPLEGQWQGFDVKESMQIGTKNSGSPFGTTITTPPCVVPKTGIPQAPKDNPIRKEGWVRFTVPSGATYEKVTIQYDNVGFNNGNNPANAALAVYTTSLSNTATQATSTCNPNGSNPTPCAACIPYETGSKDAGLFFINCVNNVWEGNETLTTFITPGQTYWVRVMNVSTKEGTMRGRIRVFPFVECTLGTNMVIDPDFANWRKIQTDPSDKIINASGLNPGVSEWFYGVTDPKYVPDFSTARKDPANPSSPLTPYRNQGRYIHSNPLPNTMIGGRKQIDYFQLFATEYGYLRDNAIKNANKNEENQLGNLWRRRGEFNPEGYFGVSQQAWSYKNIFHGYGLGYTGFGYAKKAGYCKNPIPNDRKEACLKYGSGPKYKENGVNNPQRYDYKVFKAKEQTNFPAPVPVSAEANYLLVNGWWNRTGGAVQSGRVWCQTISDGLEKGDVEYFVFSAYFQNLLPATFNFDVPQMRFSICDMAHPEAKDPTDPTVADPLRPAIDFSIPKLPGRTKITTSANAPGGTLGLLATHEPRPTGDRVTPSPAQPAYGAAMPCNLSTEPKDRRLKVLGSDFYINESPDQWMIVKCIYRKPKGVDSLNICIENLSLTKNGNDFAIDQISFQKCQGISDVNPDFEKLLRGDACEISDNPERIGVPLGINVLDFTGYYNGKNTLLSWTTIAEENVKKFVVERSANGKDFYTIGEVDAKGEASGIESYIFTDQTVPTNQRFVYYRLYIMGTNGDNKSVNVIRVEIPQFEQKLILSPNPVAQGDNVKISFTAPLGKAQLRISDILGNYLMDKEVDLQSGLNSLELSTAGMKAGVYIITILQGDKRAAAKLVIH